MNVESQNRQAGFTLIETVMVLAIAALVFSVGALSLSALKGRPTPLKSAAEIAQLMNAVHMSAARETEAQSVVIDLKAKRVTAAKKSGVQIPADYALSVVVGRETVTNQKSLEIFFLPDGTSSGGEILISSPKGDKARIDVNWLTGLARVIDASR